MDEENEQSTIIIDIGTSQCKIGFSGENNWPYIVPTCVGHEKPKSQRSEFYWNMSDYYKTINKNYSYPIKHGIITDFREMKDLYDNIFERELRVSPEFHKLFITQPIFNPLDKMEKQAEIFFESRYDYCVPALYIGNQAVLSLIGKGYSTGFSLESGEGITQLVPIYDGFALQYAATKFRLAGRDLDEFMLSLLRNKYYRFSSLSEIGLAKLIKEKECYVAENYEKEKNKIESSVFTLPDESSIIIKEEIILCPDALFNPEIMGKGEEGIVEASYNSIQKCDDALKSEMFGNIVISGGNTNFKGFNNRFLLEMKKKVRDEFEIKIHDVEDKIRAAWQGANILSMMPIMESYWINKFEYEEYGNAILHRKIF